MTVTQRMTWQTRRTVATGETGVIGAWLLTCLPEEGAADACAIEEHAVDTLARCANIYGRATNALR